MWCSMATESSGCGEVGKNRVARTLLSAAVDSDCKQQAVRAGLLPLHHRDPFDRLVAQAQALNTPILSADTVLDRYDIKRLW